MATVAQPQTITGPVRRYLFTETSTIKDLCDTVNKIEKEGRPPFLKFVGSRGKIEAVEVLVEDPRVELTPAGRDAIEEMGVAGAEDNGECLLPDPAHADDFTADGRYKGEEAHDAAYSDLGVEP